MNEPKRHNQKRRRNSKIVSFLCPLDLLDLIDAAVRSQQSNTLSAPLTGRSEWLIRAIKRDLDHRRRSQQGKKRSELPQPIPALGEESSGFDKL